VGEFRGDGAAAAAEFALDGDETEHFSLKALSG
jgi:hypothetical protein